MLLIPHARVDPDHSFSRIDRKRLFIDLHILNGKELPADTRPIVFAYHFTEILKAQVFPFQA
ncbi:hypothetical protein [Bacteroides uniformis]|uniref:hypothetical protein n=1 Tax=Bacteroides uniformis TaxID=820 RepID=UPI00374E10DB